MLVFNGRKVKKVYVIYDRFNNDEFIDDGNKKITITIMNDLLYIDYINCNNNGYTSQIINMKEVRCINIEA